MGGGWLSSAPRRLRLGNIAGSYQRYFPKTLVTLPVITSFAFPPIGEDRHPVPRSKARSINDHLLDVLASVAAHTLAGHLVLQDCFLIGDLPADQRTVGLARANGIPVWAACEPSIADDFFKPLRASHLHEWCLQIIKYLELSPGWRFLIDGDYEDAWVAADLPTAID